MNLSIATSAIGSPVQLTVSGDIAEANVGQLHDAVTAATTHSRPSTIVLDFAGIGFIDSAGIGVLVACHKLGDVGGCVLRLAKPLPLCTPPAVRDRHPRPFRLHGTGTGDVRLLNQPPPRA